MNWKARGGNQLKHSTTVTALSYKKNPRKALSVQTIIDPTATPPETLKKPIKSGVDYQSPTLMQLPINQRSCQDKPLSYSSVVSGSNCHYSPPHFSESLDISNNLIQAQVKANNNSSPVQELINTCSSTDPHQVTNPLVDKYTSYQGANSSAIDEMMDKLPTYQVMALPNFTWGSIDGGHFRTLIDQAYQEVVHWRKNMFQVPWGTSGRQFVSELARLFQAHAEATALESVAITAAMVMPHLCCKDLT